MSTFDVKTDTLLAAADQLEKAIDSFDSAAAQAYAAGNNLCGNWEGDSKVKFQTEQDQVNQWYRQMSAAAQTGVAILRQIAQTYQEADETAAGAI